MDRINRILNHNLFIRNLRENEMAEENRPFCHHDMTHFMDVARIGWILNLEENCGIPKDWIYAAALLHDIGRHDQYADGTPHEKASAVRAPEILRECGFSEEETGKIVEAIAGHRDETLSKERSLRGILYRADKLSRPCFACKAEKDCNWKAGKKNLVWKW